MRNMGGEIVETIKNMCCILWRTLSVRQGEIGAHIQRMVEPRDSLSFLRKASNSSRTRTSRSTVT